MIKNCSGCKGRHVWPFGSQCVLVKSGSMAEGKPYKSREDPAYLTYLEDQLELACIRSENDSKSISSLVSRMDVLEVSTKKRKGSTNPFDDDFNLLDSGTEGVVTGVVCIREAPSRGLHGSPSGVTPAADLVGGTLTSALRQLSQAIDPSPVSKKGMVYRQEYYIQHIDHGVQVKSLDHTKLTFKELVSGMGRVMQHLFEIGGDLAGYLGHFNFVAEQAHQHNFSDQAFVGYDRFVVDKYIKLETANKSPLVFSVGEVLGVSSHFHAGNFMSVPKKSAGSGFRGSRGGRYPYRRYGDYSQEKGREVKEASVPEGFPEDICYAWNYKSCSGKCSKKHECRVCGSDHKASNCQSKNKKQCRCDDICDTYPVEISPVDDYPVDDDLSDVHVNRCDLITCSYVYRLAASVDDAVLSGVIEEVTCGDNCTDNLAASDCINAAECYLDSDNKHSLAASVYGLFVECSTLGSKQVSDLGSCEDRPGHTSKVQGRCQVSAGSTAGLESASLSGLDGSSVTDDQVTVDYTYSGGSQDRIYVSGTGGSCENLVDDGCANYISVCPLSLRLRKSVLVSGVNTQLKPDTWSYHLQYEDDVDLKDYLWNGISEGFDIVDRNVVIDPYECVNYSSCLLGTAFDYVDGLIHKELAEGKFVIADNKPVCVHSLGAIPKANGSFRPITDCKRPLYMSINN